MKNVFFGLFYNKLIFVRDTKTSAKDSVLQIILCMRSSVVKYKCFNPNSESFHVIEPQICVVRILLNRLLLFLWLLISSHFSRILNSGQIPHRSSATATATSTNNSKERKYQQSKQESVDTVLP
jgi:hypothetical protein